MKSHGELGRRGYEAVVADGDEREERLADLRWLAERACRDPEPERAEPTVIVVPASVRWAIGAAHVLEPPAQPAPVGLGQRVAESLVVGVMLGGIGLAVGHAAAHEPAARARSAAVVPEEREPAPVGLADAARDLERPLAATPGAALHETATATSAPPAMAEHDRGVEPPGRTGKHRGVASSASRAPVRARSSSAPAGVSTPAEPSEPANDPPATPPPSKPAPGWLAAAAAPVPSVPGATPPDPTAAATLEHAMATAVAAPERDARAAPSGGTDREEHVVPFDRGAAMAALARAAAAVGACTAPPGEAGRGGVTVVFGPSGAVESAVVDGAFAGTPAGACVARAFRAARVPPFTGAPVRVHRSFSID